MLLTDKRVAFVWKSRMSLGSIVACRTPALGGHAEACDDCGVVRVAYNVAMRRGPQSTGMYLRFGGSPFICLFFRLPERG